MTVTYKAQGALVNPVNDLEDAREFLREHSEGIHEYIYPDEAKPNVHSVTWDLRNRQAWEVTLVADEELPPAQLKLLSEWISGQNSDGIGEGFEQQLFSEEAPDYDDFDETEEVVMASFDWQDNPCTLERAR